MPEFKVYNIRVLEYGFEKFDVKVTEALHQMFYQMRDMACETHRRFKKKNIFFVLDVKNFIAIFRRSAYNQNVPGTFKNVYFYREHLKEPAALCSERHLINYHQN